MNRSFLFVFYSVLFIFGLGVGALMLLSGLLYLAGVDWLWARCEQTFNNAGIGIILIIFFGCLSVALAIYDGEFVGRVKASHWSKRQQR